MKVDTSQERPSQKLEDPPPPSAKIHYVGPKRFALVY